MEDNCLTLVKVGFVIKFLEKDSYIIIYNQQLMRAEGPKERPTARPALGGALVLRTTFLDNRDIPRVGVVVFNARLLTLGKHAQRGLR